MKNLTKPQRNRLHSILANLKAGQAYLRRPDTVIACKSAAIPNVAPLGHEYHSCRLEPGFVLAPMDKEIGSHLAMLHQAIGELQEFVEK